MWVLNDGEKQRFAELAIPVVVEDSTRVQKCAEKELELRSFKGQDSEGSARRCTRSLSTSRSIGFVLVAKWTLSRSAFCGWGCYQSAKDYCFTGMAVLGVASPSGPPVRDAKFPVGKEPFLKLVLDANIEARMGTYMQEFSLSDLRVKVDIVTLLEPMSHRHAPPIPVMLVTGDGGIQTDLVYFDILRTFVLSVDLEYSITRKDIVSSTGGGHSMISGSYAR
ncbi:hypothetical protein GN244_ATG01755 [Phytophthora infestans]|uniref:Uncharacterized protein n=1 Tax=Phytophthora infestans TaxID=4787 RepID=A0A833X1V5_PHYIN|nr:hypothetical protein GN244_ATG01755 [Phytophthora infestans]